MTEKVVQVVYSFLVGNLFGDWEGVPDPEDWEAWHAAAERYARLVEARLQEEFPEAEVKVSFQYGEGASSTPWIVVVDEESGEETICSAPEIRTIANEVWREQFDEWFFGK